MRARQDDIIPRLFYALVIQWVEDNSPSCRIHISLSDHTGIKFLARMGHEPWKGGVAKTLRMRI